MSWFTKTILRGFAVLLPLMAIGLTIYWSFFTIEKILAQVASFVLPNAAYFPGLGVLFGLIAAFTAGVAMNAQRVKDIQDFIEVRLKKIPLIKTIYGSVQDVIELFSKKKGEKYNAVVLLDIKEIGIKMAGFVTREDFHSLHVGNGAGDNVAVYLPMSYQIGGYLVLVSRKKLKPLDMTFEEATRFIFTAAMSADAEKLQKTETPEVGV